MNSYELQNAVDIPSSITHNKIQTVDVNSLKDNIKLSILNKDASLMKAYDVGNLFRSNSNSGNETLKIILHLLRDYMTNKFKDDNTKNLTIRKNFDIMVSSLECLMINNIDCSSPEINTLMLSFLTRNFL